MPNVTFHNDLALAIAISHKGADKLAGIVKGNFVRLLILGQKVGIMGIHSRPGIVLQARIALSKCCERQNDRNCSDMPDRELPYFHLPRISM